MPEYLWQVEPSALLTVALPYVRVSKAEMKQEGRSVPAQHALIREYVNTQQNWMLGNEGRAYEDVQQGTRVKRDAYQALLTDARLLIAQGRHVVIVVMMMDRFGRDRVERLRAWDEMRTLGIDIYAIREGGHQTDDLLEGFKALIANFEVKQLGQRIRNVFDFLHGRGWYHVGKAPWGYAFRAPTPQERAAQSPKAVLDMADDQTVSAVLEAWQMRARGDGLGPVSTWAASLPEELRGPRALDTVTMRTMFKNPAYIGRRRPVASDLALHPDMDRHDPLTWPRGNWPQIVPDDLWLAVQSTAITNARVKSAPSQKYAMTSLLQCPKCLDRMAARPNRQKYTKKDGTVSVYNAHRYVCMAPQLGAGHDTTCMFSVSGGVLDAEVARLVRDLLDSLKATSPRTRRELVARNRNDGAHDQTARKIETLLKQRNQIERVLAKASEKVVLDEMDPASYAALQKVKLEELRAVDEAVAQLRPKQPSVPLPLRLPAESLMATVAGWADSFPTASPPVRRAMYGYLFEYVTPVAIARGQVAVRIKWTPVGWSLLNWAAELSQGVSTIEPIHAHTEKTAEAIFRSAKTGQAVDLPFEQLERDDR